VCRDAILHAPFGPIGLGGLLSSARARFPNAGRSELRAQIASHSGRSRVLTSVPRSAARRRPITGSVSFVAAPASTRTTSNHRRWKYVTSTMRPCSRAVVFCADAIGAQHEFVRRFFCNRTNIVIFELLLETENKLSVSQIAHAEAIPSIFALFDWPP